MELDGVHGLTQCQLVGDVLEPSGHSEHIAQCGLELGPGSGQNRTGYPGMSSMPRSQAFGFVIQGTASQADALVLRTRPAP